MPMDFSKFLTRRSSTEEVKLLDSIAEDISELIKVALPTEEVVEIEEDFIEELIDYSNPTFLTDRLAKWKITDYQKHAFILGREYRPEWAAAAMYMASWLIRKGCKSKVVVPVKWMRTKIPRWFEKDLIAFDTQMIDLIDDDYSFWFWGFEGKKHWLPTDLYRELRNDTVRLQVVDSEDRNRWMSDQVLRLKKNDGGITAFVFWICMYEGGHEYLRMALRESEDSSWMTHPEFSSEGSD